MVEKLKCYLCQEDLGDRPEEYWCYGCRRYICDDHDVVFGRHQPDAHNGEDE